jgi:hypothetical protein
MAIKQLFVGLLVGYVMPPIYSIKYGLFVGLLVGYVMPPIYLVKYGYKTIVCRFIGRLCRRFTQLIWL